MDLGAGGSIEQPREGFGRAERAAHAGAHDREIEFVGEHALVAQRGHVARVQEIAERIGEAPAERTA